jgi:hypothetical protein
MDKFDGILIGDEHTGSDRVELVCSWCNHSLVRLSDRNSQSESGSAETVPLNSIRMMNRSVINRSYQYQLRI